MENEKQIPPSFDQTGKATEGLIKLAFGSIDGAIKLLFCGDEMPQGLDLYNVSEIKKGKNGVEIKFFDRQRALEKLCELSEKNTLSPDGIYTAIAEGAKNLSAE